MAQASFSPHPLLPKKDQRHVEFEIQTGDSLQDVLDKSGLDIVGEPRIWVNGFEEKNFKRVMAVNDVLNIKADVQGGDGSNPVAIVAMIALIYFTGGIGAAAFGAGTFGAGAVNMAIMVVGSLLINKLFPPDTPSFEDSPSPTYSLTGGRNSIRIDQPIPIICGTHKYIPDLGARPYATYEGEDQYLYQVFHFGMNPDIDILNLKIGEDVLGNYQDVTTPDISPGSTGTLTLFPGNVDSIAGSEITVAGGSTIRTSAIDTTQLQLDFEALLVAYNSKGRARPMTVEFNIEYRNVNDVDWLPFQPSYQKLVREAYSDQFTSYPAVYAPSTAAVLTNNSRKPVRKTYSKPVVQGQYEVRVTRITQESADTSAADDLTWTALRSYQPDTSDYTGQKRMGLKIRSTAQFNGAVDQLSATVSAKCLVFNGSTWSIEATSNPAWWYLYFARGRYAADGRLEFGGGFADNEIDIEGIKDWAVWCDAKDLQFNYVFDRRMVVADILNTIARAGRGAISYHTGSLSVIYDQGSQPITQVFGMSNIKADSFQVSYISEELADEIILEFRNRDLDYQLDEVRVTIPGVAIPTNPQKTRIKGVTNKIQAGKEANLIASEQVFRRRRVSFDTDVEGLMVNKGDIIVVGHDLTNWAKTGRLSNDGSQSTTQITLDRELTFDNGSGTAYYIGVRHPNGDYEVVQAQYNANASNTITLLQSLSTNPSSYPNNETQDAIWQFEPDATPGKKLKVIDIQIVGSDMSEVSITAVDEDDAYYLTEDGSYVYDTSALFNTDVAQATNLRFYENINDSSGQAVLGFTWDLSNNANGARLQITKNGGDTIDYGVVYGLSYEIAVQAKDTYTIKLLAVPIDPKRTTSVALVDTYTVLGIYLDQVLLPAMEDVTGLELFNGTNATEYTGNVAKFVWRVSNVQYDAWDINTFADEGAEGADFKDYQVQILNDDLSVRRTEYIVYNNYEYSVEKNIEDGGGTATRDFTIEVKRRGIQGQLSLNPAKLTVNNPAPEVPGGISSAAALQTIFIDLITPSDLDYEGIIVWMSETSGFTPVGKEQGAGNCVYKGKADSIIISDVASGTTKYFQLAAYDAFGTDELNYSTEFAESPLAQFEYIEPLSITDVELASGAVTTLKIAADAVTNAKIATDAVSADNIQAATIGATEIANNAITSTKIASNAVTTGKLSANSVTAAKIVANTITSNEIATGAVTADEIAANAIVAGKIAADAIVAANIVAGSVTAVEIAANTITSVEILANTIGANEIEALSIRSNEIAAGAITSDKVSTGAIVADKIFAGAVTAGKIAAGSITATDLNTTNAVITGTAQIANSIVTNAKIANATITGAKIGSLQIATNNLANGGVSTGKIAYQAVTIPKNYYAAALQTFTPTVSNQWFTILQGSFTSTGAPIHITVSALLDGVENSADLFGSMRLVRAGAVLAEWSGCFQQFHSSTPTHRTQVAASLRDTIGGQTLQYYLQIKSAGAITSSIQAQQVNILFLEVKNS